MIPRKYTDKLKPHQIELIEKKKKLEKKRNNLINLLFILIILLIIFDAVSLLVYIL